MIIILKHGVTDTQINDVVTMIRNRGHVPKVARGIRQKVAWAPAESGNLAALEILRGQPHVEDVLPLQDNGVEKIAVIFRPNAPPEKIDDTVKMIRGMNLDCVLGESNRQMIIDSAGDQLLDVFRMLPFVDNVMPLKKRYKIASREYYAGDSVVNIGKEKLGNGHFQVIAGPCAVESLAQMRQVTKDLVACGIGIIRGGAFKPRTSPYDFQGLGQAGLDIFKQIKKEFGVAITTEVVAVEDIEAIAEVADCLQIGARNAQNYNLLERVAVIGKPVLLKRGMAGGIEEWLSAAEYLMVNGCQEVILCERGIKTFETATRNTLDISAVPIAKKETHLPVVVDPSHAAGRLDLLPALSRAAIAAGADGILIEAHPNPAEAFSDAQQQIPSAEFANFMKQIQPLVDFMHQLD
jgi:3-deoxy-7-phosphoheptulonate synthase